MLPARIRYARTADGSFVAYQTIGAGRADVVFVPWFHTHLEVQWEEPRVATFLERLARIGRLLIFDKRGAGLSDPVPLARFPTLEEWMDDVRAVMDAAGSRRAAIVGHSGGGMMAMLFAATFPHRVTHLALIEAYPRLVRTEDYPHGVPPEWVTAYRSIIENQWGTGASLVHAAPSLADDPHAVEWLGRYERMSASPGSALAMLGLTSSVDLRSTLAAIQAPTLLLHRLDNPVVRVEHGRYLAAHIPGARLVELPGRDHAFFAGDTRQILDEIERFVTGGVRDTPYERVLATIVFTDIVESTVRAGALGDAAWRARLDEHDAATRLLVERYGGTVIKHTGDGVVARFDGPARAIHCAVGLRDTIRAIGLELRVGVHTGEVVLKEREIGGLAVHLAARVQAAAAPGEVLVSQTVRDLALGADIVFRDRGLHALKGFQDTWRLYAIGSS